MVLDLFALRQKARILHFAPEICLTERLVGRYGRRYKAFDIAPDRYQNAFVRVRPLDLCTDLNRVRQGRFDLILHNHVLEHLPCSYERVLTTLNEKLRPGGVHLFSVPFRGDVTREDLSPRLSDSQRTVAFGQPDHMRLFGRKDFPETIRRLFRRTNVIVDVGAHFSAEKIRQANIPTNVADTIGGHTIFYYIKE